MGGLSLIWNVTCSLATMIFVSLVLLNCLNHFGGKFKLVEPKMGLRGPKRLPYLKESGWGISFLIGFCSGLIGFLNNQIGKSGSALGLVLAIIFLICTLLYMVGVFLWFRAEGEEMVDAVLASLLVFVMALWPGWSSSTILFKGLLRGSGFEVLLIAIPFLLAIVMFFFIFAELFAARRNAFYLARGEVRYYHVPMILRIIGLALVIIIVLITVLTAVVKADTGANSRRASNQGTTTATEEVVDLIKTEKVNEDELKELMLKEYADISDVLLTSSLSEKDKDRRESTGFYDALTFGFKSEKDEGKWKETVEEIFRNPDYGIAVIESLMKELVMGVKFGNPNPWMAEAVEKDMKEGLTAWTEKREGDDEFHVTTEYRRFAATAVTLLKRFEPSGVKEKQTRENWCLNFAAEDNARRGVKADYQHKKPAWILVLKAKNGETVFEFGLDVLDKRPEFFEEKKEEKETSTEQQTTHQEETTTHQEETTTHQEETTTQPETETETTTEKPKDKSKGTQSIDGEEGDIVNPDTNPGTGKNTSSKSGTSTDDSSGSSSSYDNSKGYNSNQGEISSENATKTQVEGSDSDKTPTSEKPKAGGEEVEPEGGGWDDEDFWNQ